MQNKGLFLILTYQCNLKCKYCYEQVRDKDNIINIHDNLARVINIIRLRDDINHITVIGGEAFLYKAEVLYLLDSINDLNKNGRGISINFITNGTIYIDLNKYKDFIHLQISIDGWKNIQNKYRPFKNESESYDIVIKNIKLFFNDGIEMVLHSVVSDYKEWKKTLDKLINDVPSIIPIEVKYVYGKEANIFQSLSNIINSCKMFILAHKHGIQHKRSESTKVCGAGIRHLTVDLNTAKLYYCQECVFYQDKSGYEVGELMPNIFVDPDKFNKIYPHTNIENYRIHFFNKSISDKIFNHINIDICPFRNKEITGKWNLVPAREIIFSALNTILKKSFPQ